MLTSATHLVRGAAHGCAAAQWRHASTLAGTSLSIISTPVQGRGVYATAAFAAGAVLLEDEPLVAVGDPSTAGSYCQRCFNAVGPGPAAVRCVCGYTYCCTACRAEHWDRGHEALCGGTSALDAYCAVSSVNFPRAAAGLLASSLAAGTDFSAFWARVNTLAHVSTGLPPDAEAGAYPIGWRSGYEHVKAAISPRLGGPKDVFFEHAFSLRFYARLMGVMRLNTFSFRCPLDREPGQGVVAPPPAPVAADAVAGCCSDNGSGGASSSSCGSEESSCGSGSKAGEAPGGTALYERVSLFNHDCDPTCDVHISGGGTVTLRARKLILPGEQCTVTYLDSSLPVELRRVKLKLYGFDCVCGLCIRQLAEQAAHRRSERLAAAAV